jgi:4-amino-4-deoxy-L-arabinose transferase-like glycosyltransferase
MNVARSLEVRNIRELERSRWLIAVLVLYLGMAVGYSLTVPIFEAPDEPAHFLYANDLAAGDGLPVLDYSESPKEYHQPPLYYWLVAGVLRWFDTDGYKQSTVRNPHAAISDASTFGNKNAYLHNPRREGWPFKGLSLAVHMGRLVSIGLGLVTVWATYRLALKLFFPDLTGFACPACTWGTGTLARVAEPGRAGGRQARGNLSGLGMAAAAASVVAFNPQFLFISSALNNDNAVTALSSLALWATVTYYERPRSVRWLVALGGLSGLAILTKTTGLAVIALILGMLAAKAVRQRLIRMLWLDAGIVILLAALIGGWWYVRNALLYADPLLSHYIHRWLSDEVAAPRTAIEILHRFEQGEISFWGTFGWLSITWDEWIYKLLRTWTRLSGLGLLVLGVRCLIRRSPFPACRSSSPEGDLWVGGGTYG